MSNAEKLISLDDVYSDGGAFAHLNGYTYRQILSNDTNGDNILMLLKFRCWGKFASSKHREQLAESVTGHRFPKAYLSFDKEFNAYCDTYLYANPSLLNKYRTRYSKGELKLVLREVEVEQKIKKEQQIKAFQRAEDESMQRYLSEELLKLRREKQYEGIWGAW